MDNEPVFKPGKIFGTHAGDPGSNRLGIEIVCSGNGGRSPIGETVGRDYVKQLGLENQVSIYSSGTMVNDIKNLNLSEIPATFLVGCIEIGLKSGTYQGKACDAAKRVVDEKDKTVLALCAGDVNTNKIVRYCIDYLMVDEVTKRNTVLLEKGLVAQGNFHKQTTIREDIHLILPMKKSNAEQVKDIYENRNKIIVEYADQKCEVSDTFPQIKPICEYAGMNCEISDPFGGTIDDYRKARDLIGKATLRSITNAINNYWIRIKKDENGDKTRKLMKEVMERYWIK